MTLQTAPTSSRRAAFVAAAGRGATVLLVLAVSCSPSVKDMMIVSAGSLDHVRLFTEEQASDSVAGFRIDKTEVSVKQYQACVDDQACELAGTEEGCNSGKPERQRHPINCVSWDQARAYCEWLERRLPTAEEWEYAGRAGGGQEAYPWGDEPPSAELVNACGSECTDDAGKRMYPGDDGATATAPCGSYPQGRNRFGLLDMAGNVQEWTETMVPRKSAGSAEDSDSGAGEDSYVLRGGGFNDWDPWFVQPRLWRPEYRSKQAPDIGFRCAKSLK